MPPNDSHVPRGFYEELTAAIADLTEHGFTDMARVQRWVDRLRAAAIASMVPEYVLARTLANTFRGIWRVKVERGGILAQHPGVSRFTLERVRPALRAELDRRIMASADLIKLNRARAIEDTLQRFSGWATSIPIGGTEAGGRREASTEIRKSIASLPFRERRVAIDQGHKFASNLSEILATDGGAIAGTWHSQWRRPGYDARIEHKERDLHIYVVRGNWALEKGLMRLAGHQYTDEITKPGEEVFCSCHYQWIYSPRRLPDEMLTTKGREVLAAAKAAA